MILRNPHQTLILVLFAILAFLRVASGQAPRSRSLPSSNGFPTQVRPVSLPHLYWHFLVYQNHLDTKAAAKAAAGENASGLRNHLQQKLAFSETDFAPIRTSSTRLAAEIQALDARAAAIKAAGMQPTSYPQLTALTVQREADINAEIVSLKRTLPPEKIRLFEAFLVRYFSPSNSISHPTGTPVQAASGTVQP